MRVAMIGTGYVGLVSGACFSEFGHDVVCVDKDEAKIAGLHNGKMPIYEPGLEGLVESNVKAGRLTFTRDLESAIKDADAVFIAVGTPSRRGDGHADLSYVYAAAEEIAKAMNGYTVVVTKSTVPVGTGREVEKIIRETRPDADFDVVSNPEFLREGSAIEDFMRPDRVVIGTTSERAQEVMRNLYRPLYLIETPIVFTSRQSSELIKYAANTFLATKITFINEIADLCEQVDANVHDVARGIGLDGRIGKKFLHAGPGYGGSCFPKDTRALVSTAQDAGSPLSWNQPNCAYMRRCPDTSPQNQPHYFLLWYQSCPSWQDCGHGRRQPKNDKKLEGGWGEGATPPPQMQGHTLYSRRCRCMSIVLCPQEKKRRSSPAAPPPAAPPRLFPPYEVFKK